MPVYVISKSPCKLWNRIDGTKVTKLYTSTQNMHRTFARLIHSLNLSRARAKIKMCFWSVFSEPLLSHEHVLLDDKCFKRKEKLSSRNPPSWRCLYTLLSAAGCGVLWINYLERHLSNLSCIMLSVEQYTCVKRKGRLTKILIQISCKLSYSFDIQPCVIGIWYCSV